MATNTPTKRNAIIYADSLTVTGNITAPSYNNSNWDTAYGWGDHSTENYATQAYVTTAINNLVASAPGTLDTLNELAAALGDDPNFATTVSNNIGTKVSKSGDTMTGTLTAPTGVFNNLTIGTSNKIKFANNDYIRYDDANGVGRFHFDCDGGTNNASVQAATFVGALSGNAATSSKWITARTNTVTLTGDVSGTGSASVDGSGNWTVSVPTVVANNSHTHDDRYVKKTGDTMSGQLTVNSNVVVTGDLKLNGSDSYIWTPNTAAGYTGFWDQYNARLALQYTNNHSGWGVMGNSESGTALKVHGNSKITGGLEIAGNLARGSYTSASQYHTNADNIVLKGNASGISGIFFESEKDGTNINHSSDFGFIQFHPYGTGTSGESNELIIGVSNDGDDHVVVNAPNVNGFKFRIGASATDYTVWHAGNFNPNDYLLTSNYVDTDNYVDSVSFSTTTGVLTLGRTGSLPDLTVDLDNRYELAHSHPYLPISGSWFGDLGSNGYTRYNSVSSAGGVISFVTKNSQMSTIMDGAYLSYESANGFFGSYNSQYGNLSGIQATGANTVTVKQLDGGSANLTITGNLTVNGSIAQADGFGTLYTFNTTQGLSTSWADVTAIAGNALPTGTYAIQIFINNSDVGGNSYSEYYSGTMSWYGSGTNDNDWNEIPLHNAGHAQNGPLVYARTLRRSQSTMILQLAASGTVGSDGIQIKLRRLI